MIRSVIEWCIRNPLLVCVVYGVVALAGIWTIFRIPIDAIPDLSDTQVIISTEWMGRDPQTVEDQITYPLTTAMLAISRVRDVRGYSFFGQSFVYVIFEDGTDIYWARSRVLEYLNQVSKELPEGVTPTLGPDATGLGWVFIYTVEDTGNRYDLSELRAVQDFYIRYQLLSVPGVAEVASIGGVERQYQVRVDPSKLLHYRISLSDVVDAIRRNNNDFGGSVIEIGETEFMVRGRGYVKGIRDIEMVVINTTPDGTPVLVRDVADVGIGPDVKRGVAEKDGLGEVVAGIVVARYGANTLEVIEGVKKKIETITQGLPEGMVIRPVYDRSGLIQRAISTLREKLLEEILIVSLVTLLFLLHVRSSLVASITLPLGVMASFVIMYVMGINANIMSLGGIAVAIGAMVDGAVVIVENTHKHLERAGKALQGWRLVLNASMEVASPLFFSLLVITVSFLPVFSLEDQVGRLFKPLAYTKTFAMGASSIIAITLIPVLTVLFVKGRIRPERTNPVTRLLVSAYKPLLHLALRYRKTVLFLALSSLLLTYIPFSRLGGEFMPPLKEGDILYMPTTLPGLSVAEATRTLMIQDRILKQFPEVRIVLGKIGRATTPTDPAPLNMVETHVILHPEDEWHERIIEERVVYGIALRMAELLMEDGIVRDDIPFEEIATWVEERIRPGLNVWIREELVRGRGLSSIKKELTVRLKDRVSSELIKRLEATGYMDGDSTQRALSFLDGYTVDEPLSLRRTTFDELTKEEMNGALNIPGMPNWWLMPIETRVGMLTTGMKGLVGVKIRGEDLQELERIALEVERVLVDVPGTLSVSAERAMGGSYLDIDIDRLSLARYGLGIEDVEMVVESAVGGMNISRTVEGRYRFPVNVRYPQELRDDPERLKRILISTSHGGLVPLGQVARIRLMDGPAVIKSENGLLLTTVPVDLERGVDIQGYVKRAQSAIDMAVEDGRIGIPSGYYMEWSGQFEFMEEVKDRLMFIVPLTVFIIFVLLYLNFTTLTDTLLIMVSLPFSVVGGVWLVWLLGYNMSVAVAVGLIALMGLASETGVLMLVYLNLAYEKRKKEGRMHTEEDLFEAIVDGAVGRMRPKVMVVSCLVLGLLPIMYSAGVGSGPMKRMVAPMIGGLVSSTVLTLLVIPAVYFMLRKRTLNPFRNEGDRPYKD